jgi:biopolymer transport protein ExbD
MFQKTVATGEQKRKINLANKVINGIEKNGLHHETSNLIFRDMMTTLFAVAILMGLSVAMVIKGEKTSEQPGAEISAAEISSQDQKPLREQTIAIYALAQGTYRINIDPTEYSLQEIMSTIKELAPDPQKTAVILSKDYATPSGVIDDFVAQCFKDDYALFIIPAEK